MTIWLLVWDDCVSNLARTLAELTLTLDVGVIIVGGGLSESGAQLLDPLVEKVHDELSPLRSALDIRLAALGQLAGARGAALHALAATLSAEQREAGSRVVAGSPDPVQPMFMLAFDHRSSTAVELFGQPEVSPGQWQVLAEAKTVTAEAAVLARSDLAAVGGDRGRYRSEVLPTQLPTAVGEITRRLGAPDLWKLEGVASPIAAAAVSEAACSGGTVPPVLTLGAAADRTEIAKWFAAGSYARGYGGFAIGRSIWKAPVAGYLSGRLDRDATREAIRAQFAGFVDDYLVATRVVIAAGHQ